MPNRDTRVEASHVSACGPVRSENQDAAAVWAESALTALVVSDGMGGHAAGSEAADIAVRVCVESIRNAWSDGRDWSGTLGPALAAAHSAIVLAGQGMTESGTPGAPMGATLAVALVDEGSVPRQLHVAHVGDSRVYLFRGRSLYRLTMDHSLVGQMVRDGLLTESQAFGHPDSNVIQRALGQSLPLEPEVQLPIPLDDGDVVLVCSDGLHGAIPDSEISASIGSSATANEICQTLLAAALAAGSADNVTVACARLPAKSGTRRPTRVQD